MMRGVAIRLAWLLVPLALACGSPVEKDGWRIALRFIPEEPTETFERSRLYQHKRVFTWRFDSKAGRAAWKIRPPGAATPVAGGLNVRGSRPVPSLIRGVDLDAAKVDAIEIDVAGLRMGPLRWFWRREGEQFVGERGLVIPGPGEAEDEAVTYTLEVADHDAWSGNIRRLRLDPTVFEGETVRVEEVRGIRYVAPHDMPETATRGAWRVDLDSELRSALLAPPGRPIERRLEVPEGARLRFGYGVHGRLHGPVIFRVSARADSASEIAAGQSPKVLFEKRLAPGGDDLKIWREASVDLAPLAGRDLRLVLETSAVGDWDRSSGMPAFANPEVLEPAPASEHPNVVLISIDTLRADHLSLYGYHRRTSPRIDAWAARSAVQFENAVVSAPWTLPSHASMLSGLDADRHGAVNHGSPMPSDLRTLPEYLREAGYRTLAVTGGGWMRPDYGFARGVDLYRYWPPGVEKQDELELGVSKAEEWLGRWGGQPLFLFMHTFEVHSPHRRRQPFFGALTGSTDPDADSIITEKSFTAPGDGFLLRKSYFWHRKGADPQLTPLADHEIQEVIDRYDSAIAYTDDRLGRLLEQLEELAPGRETLVIITSDHGDAFGEKGLVSHGYLYDFNLLVPLIVALPGGEGAGRRMAEQVRSVDIPPTVLDILGLPVPPGLDGRSLRGLLVGRGDEDEREAWSYAASSNRGISVRLSNSKKYILNHTPWPPLQGREEIYDLGDDPGEERDLAGTDPEVRQIRQRVVRRLIERLEGIVVHVRNGEQEPLRGALQGVAIRGIRLKALAPEASPLEWSDTDPGITRFTIPPGDFGAYVIEGAGLEPLNVEVSIGDAGPRRFTVDAATLDQPWQLRYSGARWRRHRDTESAPTAVTVSRQGIGRGSAADPAANDAQLRAELRALGYLD